MASPVDIVAKLGAVHTAAPVSGNGVPLSLNKNGWPTGAGVDYRFDSNWSVRAMFEVYLDFAGLQERLTGVSVGVKYAF